MVEDFKLVSCLRVIRLMSEMVIQGITGAHEGCFNMNVIGNESRQTLRLQKRAYVTRTSSRLLHDALQALDLSQFCCMADCLHMRSSCFAGSKTSRIFFVSFHCELNFRILTEAMITLAAARHFCFGVNFIFHNDLLGLTPISRIIFKSASLLQELLAPCLFRQESTRNIPSHSDLLA